MSRYAVLVCGLNIRNHNRITVEEQRTALDAVADQLTVTWIVGDKGTYLITSDHEGAHVVDVVLRALITHRPDLKIPGAAVASPAAVGIGLAELANVLTSKYGQDFDPEDHSIRSDGELWRAGLALPLFPGEIPARRSLFEKIKNAIVLGWTNGCVLVVKREAKNVHWGNTVTDPASRRLKRLDGLVVQLTSRSGNVLRELVG